MIRILLADDEPAVRQGLKMRLGLEPDLVVVGEAQDGLEALELAGLLHPDVIIMDVEMSEMGGLTATRHLAAASPEVAIVMLTIHAGAEVHRQAMAAGATTFVEKQGGASALLDEIRRVMRNRVDWDTDISLAETDRAKAVRDSKDAPPTGGADEVRPNETSAHERNS